ncbi:MAG: acetyl-CoA carboxylase biotin carboxyl carrier protein [Propylenella sp.]
MADKKLGIDKELIRELATLLTETELTEIEIGRDDYRIRVSRAAPAALQAVPPPKADGAEAEKATPAPSLADPSRHPGCVPSPMVGTAYRAPGPDARPFVEVGDQVRVGQTILIVEAMKHMNEVPAPRAGKVVEILVEDGQPVEFGEPLMIIEQANERA